MTAEYDPYQEDALIRGWEDEYANGYVFPGVCPACGWNIDYCQGHGELGDWDGYVILAAHDVEHHEYCHGQAECVMGDYDPSDL